MVGFFPMYGGIFIILFFLLPIHISLSCFFKKKILLFYLMVKLNVVNYKLYSNLQLCFYQV